MIPNRLIGISLNTMYLYSSNSLVRDCSPFTLQEPLQEPVAGNSVLNWLRETLSYARSQSLSVYISGHIPPTKKDYYPECLKQFLDITNEFDDVIQGQFYGHMNVDHFYFPIMEGIPDFKRHHEKLKLKLKKKTKSALRIPSWITFYFQDLLVHYKRISKYKSKSVPKPILVSPSVVPAFNPSLRVYSYFSDYVSRDFGMLLDYEQYYSNLTIWNSEWNGEYLFELEYSPLKSYSFSRGNLSSDSWKDFAFRLTNQKKKKRKEFLLWMDESVHIQKKRKRIKMEQLLRLYYQHFLVQSNVGDYLDSLNFIK